MSEWLQPGDLPPALGIEDPATARIAYPAQGQTSDVAFIDGRDGPLAIKRCDRPIYLDWLRQEYEVLSWLQSTTLKVPAPLGYAERVSTEGLEGWLVMSRLEGQSMRQRLTSARPSERRELLRVFATALRELHSAAIPQPLCQRESWIERMLLTARSHLDWCDGDDLLLKALEQSAPNRVSESLIHGDMALDNVLIDDAGNIGFVDWAWGDCGDPRYDLALAEQGLQRLGLAADEISVFFATYGQRPDRKTLNWFECLCEFF